MYECVVCVLNTGSRQQQLFAAERLRGVVWKNWPTEQNHALREYIFEINIDGEYFYSNLGCQPLKTGLF